MARKDSRGKNAVPAQPTDTTDTTKNEENTAMNDDALLIEDDDNLDVALPGEDGADNADNTTTEGVDTDNADEPEFDANVSGDADNASASEGDARDIDAEAESLLNGENERIANDAGAESVVMLDVNDHLPADARVLKMQFAILDEYATEYETLLEELHVGSSDKDVKVAHYISNLTPDKDAEGHAIVTELSELDAQIKELQDKRDAADTALKTHVEAALIASGSGDLLTEEQIAAKRAEIKDKYSVYKDQYKAVAVALDNYREHKNPDAAPIHLYTTHIPSPTGARVKPGVKDGRSDGGQRAVFVGLAEYKDRVSGQWVKTRRILKSNKAGEPDRESSNPITLATEIAGKFDTELKGTELKDAIVEQWYGFVGTPMDNVDRAKVTSMIAEFPFTFKNSKGEFESVQVRIVPRDHPDALKYQSQAHAA